MLIIMNDLMLTLLTYSKIAQVKNITASVKKVLNTFIEKVEIFYKYNTIVYII
jgi:hypothetical protein